MTVPSHWRPVRSFPKNSTDASTVKNFLVVVTTDSINGPKLDTYKKKVIYINLN